MLFYSPYGDAKSTHVQISRYYGPAKPNQDIPAGPYDAIGSEIPASAQGGEQQARAPCLLIARGTLSGSAAQELSDPPFEFARIHRPYKYCAMRFNKTREMIGDTLFPIIRQLCQTVGWKMNLSGNP
jgi:hypothetical protein